MGVISAFVRWVMNLFSKKTIEQAAGVPILATQEQLDEIALWQKCYIGKAPWNNKDAPSLNIARTICSEVARNVTIELESEIQGNDYLNEQYQRVIEDLRVTIEKAAAMGKIIIRPFPFNDKILVNIANRLSYYPVRYDVQGELESAIFVERQKEGEAYYTLLTHCDWASGTYTVENTAYKSSMADRLGSEVSLDAVQAWAEIEPSAVWRNTSRPWFVPLSAPGAESIFSAAIDLIRLADEQDARITWENEAGEMAIDASSDMFRATGTMDALNPKQSVTTLALPKGKERLYRTNHLTAGEHFSGMQAWTPELRIDPLAKRLEMLKKQIETVVGLSHGTLSEAQSVEKTATEIKHGRQRFYVLVSSLQKSAQTALEALVTVMGEIAVVHGLDGTLTEPPTFHWGDSVLITSEEKEEAFGSMMNTLKSLQGLGVVRPDETRAALIEFSDFFSKLTPEMVAEAAAGLPKPIVSEF